MKNIAAILILISLAHVHCKQKFLKYRTGKCPEVECQLLLDDEDIKSLHCYEPTNGPLDDLLGFECIDSDLCRVLDGTVYWVTWNNLLNTTNSRWQKISKHLSCFDMEEALKKEEVKREIQYHNDFDDL